MGRRQSDLGGVKLGAGAKTFDGGQGRGRGVVDFRSLGSERARQWGVWVEA